MFNSRKLLFMMKLLTTMRHPETIIFQGDINDKIPNEEHHAPVVTHQAPMTSSQPFPSLSSSCFIQGLSTRYKHSDFSPYPKPPLLFLLYTFYRGKISPIIPIFLTFYKIIYIVSYHMIIPSEIKLE